MGIYSRALEHTAWRYVTSCTCKAPAQAEQQFFRQRWPQQPPQDAARSTELLCGPPVLPNGERQRQQPSAKPPTCSHPNCHGKPQ